LAESTRLVLIRHGESQATVDQVVGGHAGCKGLSELGRRQCEALRSRLARTGELADCSALYASVLPRAVETAAVLAPALGGLEVVQDCGLCEVHPGEADGLTWDEFGRRYGRPEGEVFFRRWAPGAESWSEFLARAGTALVMLADRHPGETVVVACHGGIVEAAFVALGHLPLHKPFDTFVLNTALTEWRGSGSGTGEGRWHLARYNDAAHLADVAS
jgi:probable phosphoglycerate mutase